MEIIIMLIISIIANIGLAFLIKKIDHHVKYIPIILMLILIYNISKLWHLPSLIFILIFGLFLNNLERLKGFPFIKRLEPEKLESEVFRFREIVMEITFLIRTMFFLLFGFLIKTDTLLEPNGLLIAFSIVSGFFLVRFIQLKLTKVALSPLLFIAPRGLITVLLFLSIPEAKRLPFVNEPLILQIIILSVLAMMVGLMTVKNTSLSKNGDL